MSDILDRDCIILDMNQQDKNAIIYNMIEKLNDNHRIRNKDDFFAEVLKREEIESTAVGYDIGMPHGKTKNVLKTSICFTRLMEPVVWNEHTKEKVNTVILIAVPKGDNQTHIKLVSKLARNLMHEEYRKSLDNSDKEEIYEIINNTLNEEDTFIL